MSVKINPVPRSIEVSGAMTGHCGLKIEGAGDGDVCIEIVDNHGDRLATSYVTLEDLRAAVVAAEKLKGLRG